VSKKAPSKVEHFQEAAMDAATALDMAKADMQWRLAALEEDLRDTKANRDSDLQIIEKALTIAHGNQEKVCVRLTVIRTCCLLTPVSCCMSAANTPGALS
jgi:hypothetical protein